MIRFDTGRVGIPTRLSGIFAMRAQGISIVFSIAALYFALPFLKLAVMAVGIIGLLSIALSLEIVAPVEVPEREDKSFTARYSIGSTLGIILTLVSQLLALWIPEYVNQLYVVGAGIISIILGIISGTLYTPLARLLSWIIPSRKQPSDKAGYSLIIGYGICTICGFMADTYHILPRIDLLWVYLLIVVVYIIVSFVTRNSPSGLIGYSSSFVYASLFFVLGYWHLVDDAFTKIGGIGVALGLVFICIIPITLLNYRSYKKAIK